MPRGEYRGEDDEVRPAKGYMTTNERNLWKAEVAALNKELTAVRSHMDWQAKRINELELRLNTLGVT